MGESIYIYRPNSPEVADPLYISTAQAAGPHDYYGAHKSSQFYDCQAHREDGI